MERSYNDPQNATDDEANLENEIIKISNSNKNPRHTFSSMKKTTEDDDENFYADLTANLGIFDPKINQRKLSRKNDKNNNKHAKKSSNGEKRFLNRTKSSGDADDAAAKRFSFLSNQSTKVEKRWNVFRSIPRNTDIFEPRWTLLAAQIFKILLYLLLHFAVLIFGIAAKMLLLLMTSNMGPQAKYTPCIQGPNGNFVLRSKRRLPHQYVAWFYFTLWVAYCVPEFLIFCRCLRVVLFKSVPKPTISIALIVLFLDLTGVLGVSCLIFGVLTRIDCVRASALFVCVAFLPATLKFMSSITCNGSDHNDSEDANTKAPICRNMIRCLINFVALACQASGLILWPLFDNSLPVEVRFMIPISLLLTSTIWWENFVSRTLRSSTGLMSHLARLKEQIHRSRYKLMLVTAPAKCAFALICMLLFAIRYHTSTVVFDLHNPFDVYSNGTMSDEVWSEERSARAAQSNYLMWMCVYLIGFSFLCFECAKFACKVQMDWFSVALPIAVAWPLTSFLLTTMCEENRVQPCHFAQWAPEKLFWRCDYGAAGFLDGLVKSRWAWLGVVWFLGYIVVVSHVFTEKIGRLNRTDTIFLIPMYHGLLLEQSLTLNRRKHTNIRKRLKASEDGNVGDESEFNMDAASSSDVSSSNYSMTSLSLANCNADAVPKIYICATMWHETNVEMTQMLKSILKMDEDQCARRNAQKYLKVVDPDYYELEAHIFFDDAWDFDELNETRVPNFYVQQFVKVIDHAASSVHKVEKILKPPVKIDMPYGGRLVWTLPGDNRLFVHLKDKTKVRNKKRWSQVMYMYYLLGHRIMEMVSDVHRKQVLADNTFLLTIDGDSKFDPVSVQKLVDLMKKHTRLGSACGRIHPIGSGIIVLYQKFEYAIAHWFQKAAEHVFGCVLCSPGCFSLFRASALMDDNVMHKYTKLPTEPRHFVQYDQGEDRWLSTLLLKQGYRIEYAAAADAETYAPETFDEFFNQRRRWTPSSVANTLDLLADYKRAVQNNDSISMCYVIYQMLVIFFSMLGPAIIFSMIIFAQVASFRVHSRTVFFVNLVPVVLFCVLCFTASSKVQLIYAKLMSIVYAFLMLAVMVGTGIQITTEGTGSPISIFVIMMTSIFSFAAFFHPKEFTNVFNGVIFFLMIPCTYLLMSLYALINLNVINWGTREAAQKAIGAEVTETAIEKWLRKLKNKSSPMSRKQATMPGGGNGSGAKASSDNARMFFGCSNFFECFLCPDKQHPAAEKELQDVQIQWIGRKLLNIDNRLASLAGDRPDLSPPQDQWPPAQEARPLFTVTAPTPGHEQPALAPAMLPGKLAIKAKQQRRRSSPGRVNLAASSNSEADNESSDVATACESSDADAVPGGGKPRPDKHILLASPNTPKWMNVPYLKKSPYDILDEIEHQFWTSFIEEHLKPLQKTPEEEVRVAKSLIGYRNSIAFTLLMANSLLVLALYLLQMNKDIVSIKMMPSANYTIIKWDDEKGGFKESQEPLRVESFGLIIICFLMLILLVQTLGMFLHRWQTLQHVVASTVVPWFKRRTSPKTEGQALLDGNAVEIVKRLQKLTDEEHGSSFGGQGSKNRNKNRIIFKLERARRCKQKSKCLQAAFQKRFFSFNPDKHRKSLRGIPLDKDNALFQSESSRKATAAELKRRRDSVLQQDASDLERKLSLGLEPSKTQIFDNGRKSSILNNSKLFNNPPIVKPAKLTFDESDQSSSNERGTVEFDDVTKNQNLNRSTVSNVSQKSNATKSVSFMEDLERVLKNRRLD